MCARVCVWGGSVREELRLYYSQECCVVCQWYASIAGVSSSIISKISLPPS